MSSNDSLDVDEGGPNTSNTNSAVDVGSTSEIEDIIWTLLARSGLLSQFKGEIAKCLQENGGTILSEPAKVQARADPEILRSIYEYLQWIGMKQTSAFLLSESSVRFDIATTEENGVPNLCHLFKKPASADASLSFDDQFASPIPAQQKSEPASVNLGNRTYTAGPAPSQADDTIRSELPSFLNSRQNASASLTRSSMYFTPDTGSPSYIGSKDDTVGETGTVGESRREKNKDTIQIVRLTEPNTGVHPAKSNSGNGYFHKLQEQMKTLTLTVEQKDGQESREEESNMSLRSLKSEPVDSPPPYPGQEPSRLVSYNVTASDESASHDRLRDENENLGDSISKSPTFLSPSSSEVEQDRDRDGNSQSQHQLQGSDQEIEEQAQQQCQATKEKEEDTLDESMSMSELQCSLPDNNTQDVSLTGTTSDADSKELDSCDHVVRL